MTTWQDEPWPSIMTWWKSWRERRRVNVSREASRSRVARRVLIRKKRADAMAWARTFKETTCKTG